MADIHQNSQINPYPLEIIISVYLLFTGILIGIFHSLLTDIYVHILYRLVVLDLLFFMSLRIMNRWSLIGQIRIFFPFVLLPYLYSETDYLNNLLINRDQDIFISQIEYWIFSSQPSISFSENMHNNIWAEFMYLGYFSYYLLIIIVPVYLYIAIDRDVAIKSIFIIICSFLIYYAFFILFPVAGPQFFYSKLLNPLPEGFIFGKVIRIIQSLGEAPTAAFPSSHVSICLLLLWLCLKNAGKLLIFAIPISVLLLLSTVYLRAHYVVDVIAGILTTPLVYLISEKLWQKLIYLELSELELNKEYEHHN